MSLLARGLHTIRQEGIDRALLLTVRHLSYTFRYHDQISQLQPRLASYIFKLNSNLVRAIILIFRQLTSQKYTDADPYKYIFVDPSIVEYTTGEIFSKRRGWVVDGDWDQNGSPYMQRTYAKAIEQRFVNGYAWEETVLANKYSGFKLNERTKAIEQLYQHIFNNGYKSQRQLLEEDPEAAWSGLNDAMHPLANEVAVDIGRNGELLWNICGQHRLAIAKILEVDSIPVQVFRRHTEWQKIRDRVRAGEPVPEELLDHPDLQDLVDTE